MATKSDMFVKLVLVFFISLLSFAIGTFVGKKYSDNQHKLAALEPNGKSSHATREIASESGHGEAAATHGDSTEHGEKADPGAAKAEKGVALTDAEIAKLAEEFVQDEQPPVATAKGHGASAEEAPRATASVSAKDEHAATKTEEKHEDTKKAVEKVKAMEKTEKASAHSAAAPKATKPTAAATQKPSEKVSEIAEQVAKEQILNEKDVTAKKVAEKTTTLPKEVAQSSVGKFTVQIASHPAENDAKKLAEELKKKGYAAFYVPANVKGQTYYRVSVGLFATQKEAQDYRAELVEKANVGSAFVQKIVQ